MSSFMAVRSQGLPVARPVFFNPSRHAAGCISQPIRFSLLQIFQDVRRLTPATKMTFAALRSHTWLGGCENLSSSDVILAYKLFIYNSLRNGGGRDSNFRFAGVPRFENRVLLGTVNGNSAAVL
jgi:hypothetical protein